MGDDLKGTELVDSSEVLNRNLNSPGQADELWPFVTGTLWKSAKAIGALCAAIFLYDERSNQMRTAIVLENGHSVDFFGEDRFLELREPFEIEHLPIWQTLMSTKTYQWVDLTDEANLACEWLIPWYRRLQLKGGLGVPLIFNARAIGLAVFGCEGGEAPPSDRLEHAKALLDEAALAIQLLKVSDRAKAAETAEEEIKVAGEVHENVAQSLAAISMHLALARSCLMSDPAKALKAIDQARELARRGIELARRTTHVLRPSRLGPIGTSQTLVDLIREAGRQSNLECDFRELGRIPQTVGEETEKVLLQVSREAINNALQYAESRKLGVVMTWYADRVKLEVTDDGIGFDLAKVEQNGDGYGIQGMRECVSRLGGRFEIVSFPGKGTRVSASLPVLNV